MPKPNPRIHDVKVPGHGPKPATIMCVGEAPGAEEEKERIPFVGRSGSLLNRYLERHGIYRNFASNKFEVYVTNLCKYRPYKNNFSHLEGSAQLEEGLLELRQEIQECDPNVIIALGDKPLQYLTGEKGIMKWRGSVLPCSLVEGYKVYATIHPAAVERMWGLNPVFNFDLGRAKKQSEFKELLYPEYEAIVDPPPAELWSLVDEMCEADWISIDIETFGPGNMSCIGFADKRDRGLCITFQCPGGWEAAKAIYSAPKPKKLFQYGTYDINFLRRFYHWDVANYAFDTYIAAAELMPEFPRGLDFLTSVYTWFPYYKTERKEWKEEGNLNILWQYNIKDVVATYRIAMEQMKELKELYGWSP